MVIINDTRAYKFENEHGRMQVQNVKYSVHLNGKGRIEYILNEFNNTIEKTSEVFEYYSKKLKL